MVSRVLGTTWLMVAWLGSLALVCSGRVVERDPYWQARAGLELLAGGSLSRPDDWSWAPVSGDFSQTSPLWNVTLGVFWDHLGFFGIFLLTLGSISAYFCVVARLSRLLGAGRIASLAAITVCALAALPFLSPRAALVAVTLYLVVLVIGHRWANALPGRLWLKAGATALGATCAASLGNWIHLSWFLLAGGAAASLFVMWAMDPRLHRSEKLTLGVAAAAGMTMGALMGPYGLNAWAQSERVRQACTGVIAEWMSPFTEGLRLRWLIPCVFALLIASAASIWLVRNYAVPGRRGARSALLAALLMVLVPAALGGVIGIRFIGVALLVGAPALAGVIGRTVVRIRALASQSPSGLLAHPRIRVWLAAEPWTRVLAAVLLLLSPATAVLAAGLARPQPELELVQHLPRDCQLFSEGATAATALLVRPDVKVWVDGRADYYGAERNRQSARYLRAQVRGVAVPTGTTCVMLVDPFSAPLAESLDSNPAWTKVASITTGGVWLPSRSAG